MFLAVVSIRKMARSGMESRYSSTPQTSLLATAKRSVLVRPYVIVRPTGLPDTGFISVHFEPNFKNKRVTMIIVLHLKYSLVS